MRAKQHDRGRQQGGVDYLPMRLRAECVEQIKLLFYSQLNECDRLFLCGPEIRPRGTEIRQPEIRPWCFGLFITTG